MTKRYAIKIAYIGKNYFGFQRQKKSIRTVEGAIVEALQEAKLIDNLSEARYSAAGRTDRGVNALGQVIAFDSLKNPILEELNQFLPKDIFAWAIAKVEPTFSARRTATRRTYRYYYPLINFNLRRMRKALRLLEGTHDFRKLAKKSDPLPSGKEKSTVLTLETAKVSVEKSELLLFEFASQSFLWKQVRKMTSLILGIGRELYPVEMVSRVLDPTLPPPKGGIKPMPPEGLVLYKVRYEGIRFRPLRKKAVIENNIRKAFTESITTAAVLDLMQKVLLK